MKYIVPEGSEVTRHVRRWRYDRRWSVGPNAMWEDIEQVIKTTKQATYTDEDLLEYELNQLELTKEGYYIFRLPASSGWSKIEVDARYVVRVYE